MKAALLSLLRIVAAAVLIAAAPAEGVRSRIHREPVKSTSLAAVGYSKRLQILEIEFRTGAIFRYEGVPASVYRRLIIAESKGRFYRLFIRGKYKSLRVKPPKHASPAEDRQSSGQ